MKAVFLSLAYAWGTITGLGTVAWDIWWSIQVWPNLFTIVFVITAVTLGVGSIVMAAGAFPLAWLAERLDREPDEDLVEVAT